MKSPPPLPSTLPHPSQVSRVNVSQRRAARRRRSATNQATEHLRLCPSWPRVGKVIRARDQSGWVVVVGGGGGGWDGGGVRSIFYTPAQPQRSSRLEGRRHTRQESRGESVSLRSARPWGGDSHSVRAASAGHIETDAHEPIWLSAARLRSQFFYLSPSSSRPACDLLSSTSQWHRLFWFTRPQTPKPPPLLSRLRNVARRQPIDPQKKKKKKLRARGKPEVSEGIFSRDEAAVWRQFSRKCHHGTGCCDCKHAIPIRR